MRGAAITIAVEAFRPGELFPWFLFVLMASHVFVCYVVWVEFIFCNSKDFEAKVAIALRSDGRIKVRVPGPVLKSVYEGEGITVDNDAERNSLVGDDGVILKKGVDCLKIMSNVA